MVFGALFGGHYALGDHQGGAHDVPQHLCPLTWGMWWTPPHWGVAQGDTMHYWKGSGAEWLRAGLCRQVDLGLSSGSTTSWIYDLDKLFIFTKSHLYLYDRDSCVHLLDCFED